MIDPRAADVGFIRARFIGEGDILRPDEIRAVVTKEGDYRRERRVTVQVAPAVKLQQIRVDGAVGFYYPALVIARRKHALSPCRLVVDGEEHIFVAEAREQFGGNGAVFTAADGYDIQPRRDEVTAAGERLTLADYIYERIHIGRDAVAVKKFAEASEPELFEPKDILAAQAAAEHPHRRRTSGFPIADRLRHAEAEGYPPRGGRIKGVNDIQIIRFYPRGRCKDRFAE